MWFFVLILYSLKFKLLCIEALDKESSHINTSLCVRDLLLLLTYLCSFMQFKHRLRGMISAEHKLGNTYSLGVQVIM